MAQNVTIAGNQYPDVPSILVPKTGGGGNAIFADPSVVTAVAADVASGKYFLNSSGALTQGTASGGGGTDFIVTLSYDSQSDMWLPDCTYAELYSAYSGGKTIAWNCDDVDLTPATGWFDNYSNYFVYTVYEYFNESDGEGSALHQHIFSSAGVSDEGRADKDYNTYDATALPADVANGKIFYNANGRQTGTASGGGASNIVTGTFKGTTTGAAMDVTLNYSGSGYPIVAAIYPSGGVAGNSAFSTLVQRYAAAMFCVTKASVALTPAYAKTANIDDYVVLHRYKSSTSNALTYGQASGQTYITTGADPTPNNTNIMNFKSKTTMSVYIASNSYGFAANIEYTYWVLYSS